MKKAHVRENVGQQPEDQEDQGEQQQGDQPRDPYEPQRRDGVGGALLPRVITTVFGLVFARKYST